MSVLAIIGKVFLTFALAGVLSSSLNKLSPRHRNPEIAANIEIGVGIFGLICVVVGLYYVWIVW